MAQTLDFTKIKKNYLPITLNDEKKTKLLVMTPTKKMLTELSAMMPESAEEVPGEKDLSALYTLSAKLMSRNKTGTHITGEQLEKILDFEDLIIFFNAYTDFIVETANSKN